MLHRNVKTTKKYALYYMIFSFFLVCIIAQIGKTDIYTKFSRVYNFLTAFCAVLVFELLYLF